MKGGKRKGYKMAQGIHTEGNMCCYLFILLYFIYYLPSKHPIAAQIFWGGEQGGWVGSTWLLGDSL